MHIHNTNIANGTVGQQNGYNPRQWTPSAPLVGGQYTWGVGQAGGWYFGRIVDRADNGEVTIETLARFVPSTGLVMSNKTVPDRVVLTPGTLRDTVTDLA